MRNFALWQRATIFYIKLGTNLHRGKSRRAKADAVWCVVQIKPYFCFAPWDKLCNVCTMPPYYTLECLHRLSILQIGPNKCPHEVCTKRCLALMDWQPMDWAAHHTEVDCATPHDLHTCLHVYSAPCWGYLSAVRCASLFPTLFFVMWDGSGSGGMYPT